MDILRELKYEADDAKLRTDRMAVIMTAVLKKVKSLEDAEALRTKDLNLQKESKGDEIPDVQGHKEQLDK